MPPRQRRAGYEPGRQLSPELEAALDAEAARLAAIENPVEAVRAVSDLFIALDDALEPVAEPRLRAIAQLYRTSRSYQAVANATGLSKTRVGQLMRLARQRGF